MKENRQNEDTNRSKLRILYDLHTDEVILSFFVNGRKNVKGIHLENFKIILDNNDIVITGGESIEIIYPFEDISDIIYDESNNLYMLITSKGNKIGISPIEI